MAYYFVLAVLADGTGERHLCRKASSLAEALSMTEREDAGVGQYSAFGVLAEDYDIARAEGIEFNEADGLLV